MIFIISESINFVNCIADMPKKSVSVEVRASNIKEIESFVDGLSSCCVGTLIFVVNSSVFLDENHTSAKISFTEHEGYSDSVQNIFAKIRKNPKIYENPDVIYEMPYNTHTNDSYSEKYPNYIDPAFVIENEINFKKKVNSFVLPKFLFDEINNDEKSPKKKNLDNNKNFDMDCEI